MLTLATLLLLSAPAAPTLREAIAAYEALNDARAIAAFRKILAGEPSREVAAKAHLYLGLIAFNALHPDLADAELKKAIAANPAIDLPANSSPKAALAFAEARQEVMRELARESLAAPAPPPPLQPPPVAAPSPVVPEPLFRSDSLAEPPPAPANAHALAWVLLTGAAAAAVVAVVGIGEVESFESTRSTIVSGAPRQVTYATATGQQSLAQAFQPVSIACGIGAGLLGAGAILAW